jgi:hypothetical protein
MVEEPTLFRKEVEQMTDKKQSVCGCGCVPLSKAGAKPSKLEFEKPKESKQKPKK